MDENSTKKLTKNNQKSSKKLIKNSTRTAHFCINDSETENNKEKIKNEIIEFVNNNIESCPDNSNLSDFNSLLANDDLLSNLENDEDIQNYDGERLTFLLKSQILFLDDNAKSESNDDDSIIEKIECINKKIKGISLKKSGKNDEIIDKLKNPSCFESFQTSTTSIKNKNHQKELSNDSTVNLKTNLKEFYNFFKEINLNLNYANKLVENGFDDLELLIEQTKEVSALSDQNLKDIGIEIPGHRAKILIHLEQKAEIIPYQLQNEIIYNNNFNIRKEYSIENFLNNYNLKNYEKNFIDNGYNNNPLLFSQMLTRNPLTDDILKNDLGIENKGDRNKILVGLFSELKNYCKKLKTNGNVTLFYDGKNNGNMCEPCFIF